MKCCICKQIWDLGEEKQDKNGDFMCSYCFDKRKKKLTNESEDE